MRAGERAVWNTNPDSTIAEADAGSFACFSTTALRTGSSTSNAGNLLDIILLGMRPANQRIKPPNAPRASLPRLCRGHTGGPAYYYDNGLLETGDRLTQFLPTRRR